ncbi:MAG: DMT family transporter [Chloroflexota bacterium]
MNPPHPRNRIWAYLALVIGILSLGMTAMFVRWANAPGAVTGFYRLAIATALTAPLFIHRRRAERRVPSRHVLIPLLGGLFAAGDFALWNTSVLYTTASNATLLGNTAPLWVALAAILFFRERLRLDFWLGLALALTGAVFIVGRDFLLHPSLGLGDLMACGAAVFYAAYMLTTQHGRAKLDVFTYWWLASLSASIGLLVISLVKGYSVTGYPPQSWIVFLATAVVSQIIGYMSISYALGHLPASIVSPTLIGQPIVTTILAIPLLGELPGSFQVIGGLVALAGIYLVNQSHARAQQEINKNLIES